MTLHAFIYAWQIGIGIGTILVSALITISIPISWIYLLTKLIQWLLKKTHNQS
jgi:hypothetical protein